MCNIIYPVTILILFPIIALSQPDWKMAKNKNGIFVYTKDVGNKGFKQLKSVSTFSGVTLSQCFAVFKDLENCNKWTMNLRYAKNIVEFSVKEYINYFLMGVPWPFKDREAYFRVHVYQDPTDHSLNVESNIIPEYAPRNDSTVRIVDARGKWKFTPIGNGNIRVENELFADPVGFPAWLVNFFAIEGPINTVTKLRKHMENDVYKSKKYEFIRE
jgi:hypothetical protein